MSDSPGFSYIILGIGLLAQGLFFARFFVQWLASEREKRCVVPRLFWHLSIAGSVLLLVYAVAREDLIFVLIPLPNLIIYLRNLSLAGAVGEEKQRRPGAFSHGWVLAPLTVGILGLVGWVAGSRLLEELGKIAWYWAVIGFTGQLVWNSRFLIQLLASERAGRSVLPPAFWHVSLAGCGLLLLYAIHRRDPVFILAMGPNAFIYLRNLYFIRKAKEIGRAKRLPATHILIPVLLVWMILGFLGSSDFRGRLTESRRSQVAREIVDGPGRWLVPTLGGRPFLTKPPLYYDGAAVSLKLFGMNEGAARLPTAVACLIALAAVFFAGRTWRGTRTGLLACLLMATTYLFLMNCRLAEIDGVLLGTISVSIATIYGVIKDPSRREWWILGLWVSMGVGFLAKGPHALMFPLGGILLAAGSLRRGGFSDWRSRDILFQILGIGLFLLIVTPWFVYVFLYVPGTAQVFAHETLGRIPGLQHVFSQSGVKGLGSGTAHVRPLWYYVEKLPDLLPWLPFAAVGGFFAWKKRHVADRFAPAYVIAGIVMLSLISSKKEVYLLPLAPMISLMAADFLLPADGGERWFSGWRRIFFWGFLGLVSAGLVAIIPFALWEAGETASPVAGVILIALIGGGGVALTVRAVMAWRSRDASGQPLIHVLLAMVIVISVGLHVIKPAYDQRKSYKAFSREMDAKLPADARLVFLNVENYAVMFYSGRIPQLGISIDELSPGDFVLVKSEGIADIKKRFVYDLTLDGDALLPERVHDRYVVLALKDRRSLPPESGAEEEVTD